MVARFFKKPKINFKYLLPTTISNRYSLGVRKRWTYKGYELYRFMRIKGNQMNTHIVYVDTIEQLNTYLKNEFRITIE